MQWRDIEGVVRSCTTTLDREYLKDSATKVGVSDLLEKALNSVGVNPKNETLARRQQSADGDSEWQEERSRIESFPRYSSVGR